MKQWLQEIDRYACESVTKLLVGNKSDLDAEGKRAVPYETAKDLAESLGLSLIETSAKDATNVEKCFMKMASEIQRTFVFFLFLFLFLFLFFFSFLFFSFLFFFFPFLFLFSFFLVFHLLLSISSLPFFSPLTTSPLVWPSQTLMTTTVKLLLTSLSPTATTPKTANARNLAGLAKIQPFFSMNSGWGGVG